jgi:hypothetical protein
MNSLRSLINVGEKIRISSFTSLRGRDVASYVERSNIAIVSPRSPLPWPLKKLPDFACRIGDWKAQIFFFCFQNTQLPRQNLRFKFSAAFVGTTSIMFWSTHGFGPTNEIEMLHS